MKLHNSLDSYSKNPSVITIGTFDGVHIGHQKIIKRLTSIASEKELESIILTFFPHPRMVLQSHINIKLLNTIEEREAVLANSGLDHLVIKTFTKDFSKLSAFDFVKTILIDQLNAKHLIIGYDHRFGKNRSADINDLKLYGEEFGFTVDEISAQDIEAVSVSSTKIRNALNAGDISKANAYLGYHYFLTGTVIKGKGIGKNIEFPTANIYIKQDYKLIPKNGVYVAKTNIDGNVVYGMMNIGINPTVNGTSQSIEIHLFNFNKEIYGEDLKIEILERLRNEHKFDSVDMLKSQLQQDKIDSLKIIDTYNE